MISTCNNHTHPTIGGLCCRSRVLWRRLDHGFMNRGALASNIIRVAGPIALEPHSTNILQVRSSGIRNVNNQVRSVHGIAWFFGFDRASSHDSRARARTTFESQPSESVNAQVTRPICSVFYLHLLVSKSFKSFKILCKFSSFSLFGRQKNMRNAVAMSPRRQKAK